MNRRSPSRSALLAVGALLAAPLAQGAAANVAISQVFAGGGNAGAPFHERLRRALQPWLSADVALSGWTLQYASASSDVVADDRARRLDSARALLPRAAGSAAAVGASLPAPDATGTTNLAATGGKVALVRDDTALACGAAPGSCSASAVVEDLVGYGSATDYEGAGAAPRSRKHHCRASATAGGCTDTNVELRRLHAAGPPGARATPRRRPLASHRNRAARAQSRARRAWTSSSSPCSRSRSSARRSASGRSSRATRRRRSPSA